MADEPKIDSFFLPYQINWLNDNSKIKIWEKSRRIGATYVQSFEDVRDCLMKKVPSVWFSSADESAAKEYILYCTQWAEMYNIAAKDLVDELIIDDVRTLQIKFANGTRINALSSSPKAFRSKGGKVVLDEFAHHEDQMAMWKAAKPSITWGFPLRILSTHNGKQALFYKFIERIKQNKLKWNLHTTTIFDAVEDGLLDKIEGRTKENPTTKAEREQWLEEQHQDAFDETTWQEEYCVVPVDEATAFLSYDMISKVEMEYLNASIGNTDISRCEGNLYLGMDIGRRKDLTVIWVLEEKWPFLFTRVVKTLEKETFAIQKKILFELLSHPKMRRACLDATGIGMQLSEEAQTAFGKFKVEQIMFTQKSKEEMAYQLHTGIEDRTILIPQSPEIREDLHRIRKVTTAANNIRFDVEKSEVSGHADRFWSLALASHAAGNKNNGPINVASGHRRSMNSLIEKY